jgi:hypothetical protein
MSAPGASATLVDGVDVDAVVRAVLACPGVVELHGGSPGEVATYLPGRRLVGLRVGYSAVDVQVRAVWGAPAPQIAAGIQAAVAPLAGGRSVDVTIAALGDPPGADPTAAVEGRGDRDPGRTSGPMQTDDRALAMPASEPAWYAGWRLAPAGRAAARRRTDSGPDRVGGSYRSADRPKPAMPSGRPDPRLPAEPSAPLGWPSTEGHPERTRKDRR